MLPEMKNLTMLTNLETSTTFSISFAVNSETLSGVGDKNSRWPVRPFLAVTSILLLHFNATICVRCGGWIAKFSPQITAGQLGN